MEDKMHLIRVSNRNLIIRHRKELREQKNDDLRFIPQLRTPKATIEEIVNKLKTKTSVTVEELNMLKNSLIEDESLIEFVLKVDGALKGLVKYLIGNDVKKQNAAAACCCNLTLGDGDTSYIVAQATGPYLISALDSLNLELAMTSAWSLGNMASAGKQACDTLTAQGVMSKLIEKLEGPIEELRDAALYAITHFVFQLKNDLRLQHLNQIVRIMPKLEIDETTIYLLFLLSCYTNFAIQSLPVEFIIKMLNKMHYYLNYYEYDARLIVPLVYMFRFFGNDNDPVSADLILIHFDRYDMMEPLLKLAARREDYINDSLMWMMGNLSKMRLFNRVFTKLAEFL